MFNRQRRARGAGNDGEVDRAVELMDRVEELKLKKATAQANAMLSSFRSETSASVTAAVASTMGTTTTSSSTTTEPTEGASGHESAPVAEIKPPPVIVLTTALANSVDANQKLRVCTVCGAFLSIFDSDRRLADHFSGKLHLGYLQIRRKIKVMADERHARRQERGELDATAGDSPTRGRTSEREQPSGQAPRRERTERSKSRSKPRYVKQLLVGMLMRMNELLTCVSLSEAVETTARVGRATAARGTAVATAIASAAAAVAAARAVTVRVAAEVAVGDGAISRIVSRSDGACIEVECIE